MALRQLLSLITYDLWLHIGRTNETKSIQGTKQGVHTIQFVISDPRDRECSNGTKAKLT